MSHNGLIILSCARGRGRHFAAAASAAMDGIYQWAHDFGVEMDRSKTELTYLFCSDTAPCRDDIKVVMELTWLGITFDVSLRFRKHVEKKIAKASKLLGMFHLVKKKSGGISPLAAKRIYEGAVRPLFMYGCPMWWTGQPAIKERLNVLQNKFLRRITGCFKTTRLTGLYRLTGIGPVEDWLDYLQEGYLVNKIKMHTNHPLRESNLPALNRPPRFSQKDPDAIFGITTLQLVQTFMAPYINYQPTRVPPWVLPNYPGTSSRIHKDIYPWLIDDHVKDMQQMGSKKPRSPLSPSFTL